MSKDKTITLTFWKVPGGYEVKQVTNSVDYKPGDWLTEAGVQWLCGRSDWGVTVNSVDLPLPFAKMESPQKDTGEIAAPEMAMLMREYDRGFRKAGRKRAAKLRQARARSRHVFGDVVKG